MDTDFNDFWKADVSSQTAIGTFLGRDYVVPGTWSRDDRVNDRTITGPCPDVNLITT